MKPRKFRGAEGTGWAIFNHTGSPWSVNVWAEKPDAEQYLEEKRAEWKANGWGSLQDHSVQYVKVTISHCDQPPQD